MLVKGRMDSGVPELSHEPDVPGEAPEVAKGEVLFHSYLLGMTYVFADAKRAVFAGGHYVAKKAAHIEELRAAIDAGSPIQEV